MVLARLLTVMVNLAISSGGSGPDRIVRVSLLLKKDVPGTSPVVRNPIRPTIAAALAVVFVFGARAQAPAFEVASVKRAEPHEGGAEVSTSGETVTLRNTTLKNALARAFQVVSGNQVVGPAWITTERYEIVAKAPQGTPREQIPAMLAALLTERFHLKLRHENRIMREYALALGKGPLKLRKTADPNATRQDSLVEGKTATARRRISAWRRWRAGSH